MEQWKANGWFSFDGLKKEWEANGWIDFEEKRRWEANSENGRVGKGSR